MFQLRERESRLHPQCCSFEDNGTKTEGFNLSSVVSLSAIICLPYLKYANINWLLPLFSEKKIDDIADAVDDIKLLLRDLDVSSGPNKNRLSYYSGSNNIVETPSRLETQGFDAIQDEAPLKDHSVHFSRFAQEIVDERSSATPESESNDALTSLRGFTRPRDDSNVIRDLSFPAIGNDKRVTDGGMPPLDGAVHVLRWAKGTDAEHFNS